MSNAYYPSQQNNNMCGSQRRQQVCAALSAAHAAFTAQHTDPDGDRFKEACERLEKFLDLAVPMREAEQDNLVDILQLACSIHESAINNPALTRAQRTVHRRASCELTVVCNKARDNGTIRSELRWVVDRLSRRAEKAFAEDFSRCFFMENWAEEDVYGPAAPSPVLAASHLPTPRASLHDINDARQTPQLAQPMGFYGSGNGAGQRVGPSPTPTLSCPPGVPRPSLHNTNDARQASQQFQFRNIYGSGNGAGPSVAPAPAPARQVPQQIPLQDKVHAMLSTELNSPNPLPPLGRAYSMPSVMQPTASARTRAHCQGRVNGHHALGGIQE